MPTKSTQSKRSRGRPEHVATAALRRKVSTAAGGGMRHEDIAIALGISRPTLEKWYAAELSEGALGRRLEVLNAMHAAAKRGSSSAARLYLEHEPKMAPPPLPAGADPAAVPVPAPPPAARVMRLGKKDQANADAVDAQRGTDWDALLPATVQ